DRISRRGRASRAGFAPKDEYGEPRQSRPASALARRAALHRRLAFSESDLGRAQACRARAIRPTRFRRPACRAHCGGSTMTDTTVQNTEADAPAARPRAPVPATPRLAFSDGESASKWAKTLSFMPIGQAQQTMVGQLHALAAADFPGRERAK